MCSCVSFLWFQANLWASTKTKSELLSRACSLALCLSVWLWSSCRLFRVGSVSLFSCPSCLPLRYETVASILHTTGSSDADNLQSSVDQPCILTDSEDTKPCLDGIQAEIPSPAEKDDEPPSSICVDISPPTAFSDTPKSLLIIDDKISESGLSQKPDKTCGLGLVASLRLAASDQEKEREGEIESLDKENMETRRGEVDGKEGKESEEKEEKILERDEAQKSETY